MKDQWRITTTGPLMIRKIRYEDAIADDRYKAVRSMFRDCTIAGCIYSALYYVQRPGMEGEIAVCRRRTHRRIQVEIRKNNDKGGKSWS